MAKKKEIEQNVIVENIISSPLDDLMGNCYSIYAKDVIQNRAIPDVRDGLKPVQRRIIFSMYKNSMFFDKPTKKCARIVGDVIGKYHPHGDFSIYEALARMSQDWKINMPLIHFQGNNGSIDGDGPAAYRYTEAKLSLLAEELVKDIEKNTVDMNLNFDDTELEPAVLPSFFPNLYVNGANGIAVALATEIPPHNLVEIDDAIIYTLTHKTVSIDDLLQFVKGPDFPTGGVIYNSSGIRDIYATGRGRIELAAKVELTEDKVAKYIVITEIPYQLNKKDLVSEIEKVKINHEVDGILEVRDETEMHGVRIVVDIKPECDSKLILQYLLNKTPLKSFYSANIVAICDGRPRTLDLISYIHYYIDFQREIITRRSQFILDKDEARLHIVEGLYKATLIVDKIVQVIKQSLNKADAKIHLQENFGFSEIQSEAIVNLQLYKLTNTDVDLFLQEMNALKAEIIELKLILTNEKKLDEAIINDLKYISKKYGIARRTEIIEKEDEIQISARDLILNEPVMLAITRDGYVKCSSIKSYKSSNSVLPGIKPKDCLVCADQVDTIDFVLAFTSKGNFLFIPVHEIQDGKWKDEGKHINYLINLPFDEKIIKCFVIKDFNVPAFVVSVTKKGQIKRTQLKDFYALRYSKPVCMMKMVKNDELADVVITSGNDNILVISSIGNSTFFNENQLSVLANKTAGVKSMNSLKDSSVVSLLNFRQDEKGKILLLTDKGHTRIFDCSNLVLTQRLGKSVEIYKSFKSDLHQTIYSTKLNKTLSNVHLFTLDSNLVMHEFDINDFYVSPTKNAKDNLGMNNQCVLSLVFNTDVKHIDSNFETFAVEKEQDKDEKETDENDPYQQISIFDDLGD
ncbi:MAG: DNA topoisomerase (ATP-hydrolyzing) [Bacilli bacterium]